MQDDGAPPPNAQKPKSQRPHSAWKIVLVLHAADGPSWLARMHAAADKLLGRASNGGTDVLLRVIVAVGDMALSASEVPAAPTPPTPGGGGASSGTVPVTMIHNNNTIAVAGATCFSARITMFFVFDGDGRLKASVKRSIKKLEDSALFKAALAALEPWPLAAVLAFILERPAQSVRAAWLGPDERLVEYLKARVAAGNQTTSERVNNSADFMCAGMDMLGPHSRKRPLPPPTPSKASPGGGPSSGHSDDSLPPSLVRLSELLSWSGALSQEQAAERGANLLTLIQTTMEENAVFKIQAAAAAETPNGKVCVASRSVGALRTRLGQLALDCVLRPQATRSQLAIGMVDRKKNVDAASTAVAAGISQARDLTASIRALAQEKRPVLQVLYFQAAVRAQGEVFDVTCFSGVSQYHCLRAYGECGHAHLSSCHLRSTDFELACQPEENSKTPREEFAKNTRAMYMPCMVYTSAIHLAWQREQNADRISSQSACVLQSTRADIAQLQQVHPDPASEVVTVVLDIVTDKQHLHFARSGNADSEKAADNEYGVEAAMRCMANDDTSGHTVSPEEVAAFAAQLGSLRFKDMLPHAFLASALAPLADRCSTLGIELHLLLIGCNTIQAVPALKAAISPASARCVTVLCTAEVWPSDCSSLLWHLYGALSRTGGMSAYRSGTRQLLGEYTDHYQRQRIRDESLSELKIEGSLANAVHCSVLDQVVVCGGMLPQMDLL